MNSYKTVFGSLSGFEKGRIEIINDDPKHYAFSNVFEVASKAQPWEKVAVAKNRQNLIEAIRAEGTSPWYAASHDEFVLVMDGEVEVTFVQLTGADVPSPETEGNITLEDAPAGKKMGRVVLRRGHQTMLPANAAYQFRANGVGVLMQQSREGQNVVYRWSEICYK